MPKLGRSVTKPPYPVCLHSKHGDKFILLLFLVSFILNIHLKRAMKESRNRPGVAQRVPGSLGSRISWHSARKGGEVVSLTHRPPLPPWMFLVLIFTRGWVDPRAMERLEGDMSLKNPVTLPGMDPGTVRLVAQRLNHYATPGPKKSHEERHNWYYKQSFQ
jgi:hypothetical protein